MANIKKCDRCGAAYELNPSDAWHGMDIFRTVSFNTNLPDYSIDLCPACRVKFEKFLENLEG